MLPKLGIIAGGGDLPREIITECRNSGRAYYIVALKGHADPDTVVGSDHHWVRLGAAGETIGRLRDANVRDVVLAGSVKRPSMLQLRPDFWALKFFVRTGVASKGDNGLLQAIVSALETREGFHVVGAHSVLPSLLATEGVLTNAQPDTAAMDDVLKGWGEALELGEKDLGQAVVVRNGETLARESASGTAAMLSTIAPTGEGSLCGVLVKVSKPEQEQRADLPTIGPDTVAQVQKAGLAGIAIEAGKSLILDKSRTIERANEAGLFIVVRA